MSHDGKNKCDSGGYFIMEPSRNIYNSDDLHNSFLFSKCSLETLNFTSRNLIDGVPKETGSLLGNGKYNCLLNGNKDFTPGREKDIFLRLHPGQIFDLDDQCKLTFGPKSLHIGGSEDGQGLCQELKCTHNEYLHFMKTMDGTSCSDGAWCRMGKCVQDNRAPRAPEHCVNGDSVVPHLNKTCKDEINEDPNRCEVESNKDRCCASCAGKRKRNGGCQDTIDECSRLEPRDCYSKYYATTCCRTCRVLIENPWDANCLYGDKGVLCSYLVPEVCHITTRYCCQTCAAHPTPSKTTDDTSASPSQIITPNNASLTNSCIQGDFNGSLDYFTLWDEHLSLTCKELVGRNSHLCHYDVVRKHCCASCKNVEMVKGYCKRDDDKEELTYLYKKFNCRQLVDYNPRLCEINAKVKNKCCKSCGRFIIAAKD